MGITKFVIDVINGQPFTRFSRLKRDYLFILGLNKSNSFFIIIISLCGEGRRVHSLAHVHYRNCQFSRPLMQPQLQSLPKILNMKFFLIFTYTTREINVNIKTTYGVEP